MFLFAKVQPNAIIPTRNNPTDAGLDLHACIDEPITILPNERKIIETGIAVSMPSDCYARIAPRSGLAAKNGIDVLAGVVDCGYTNSLKVVLHNHDTNSFVVSHGHRIAQLIFEKIYIPQDIQETSYESLKNIVSTPRSLNGFGSSGV